MSARLVSMEEHEAELEAAYYNSFMRQLSALQQRYTETKHRYDEAANDLRSTKKENKDRERQLAVMSAGLDSAQVLLLCVPVDTLASLLPIAASLCICNCAWPGGNKLAGADAISLRIGAGEVGRGAEGES